MQQHVGVDVGKETCAIVDNQGDPQDELETAKTPDGFDELLTRVDDDARFAFEACSYAFPLHEHLLEAGYEVQVAHPRKVHLITENESKTEVNDAPILARPPPRRVPPGGPPADPTHAPRPRDRPGPTGGRARN
jgi:transposase